MSDPISTTRDTYDAIGAVFLENTRDRSAIREWLDRFSSSLPIGTLVLDLGAGPGFDSAEFRKRGLEAICMDLSLGMLRVGVREFPGPRVQSDLRRLPFPSCSIRGVWANASLLHLSKADASVALREIRRVLQPSGILHVSVKRGSGAEWESERYGKPRWFQYWSDPELDAALQAAGFCVNAAWVDETTRATWLIRLASVRCAGQQDVGGDRPSFEVRCGSRQDVPVLEAMLFEAFHWDPQASRPDQSEFRKNPEFRKLLAEWGEREGDAAVVAEVTGRPIGAAWYRFWSPERHSYGFVDASIPEIGIGVDSEYRSEGVGRALLESLISTARSAQVPALSLSVARANFALHLYESLGFRRVGESGTSLTLLLRLSG